MPNKFKKRVRSEAKEVVDLFLKNNNGSLNKEDSSELETFNCYDESENMSEIEFENIIDGANDISSSSESLDLNCFHNVEIREELACWAVKHSITNSAINDLLRILRKSMPFLPKDGRTLKKTPRDAPIVSMQGGEYVHYGLEDCLTDFLSSTEHESSSIDLNINIDGLPITKSSLAQAWPILINVNGTESVYTVGIYSGNKKPQDVNLFLTPFITELRKMLTENFIFCNKTYKISFRAVICDAPARALVLGIKSHTGYSCCHKCTQKGEYMNSRIVLQLETNNLRSDDSFRNHDDINFHKLLLNRHSKVFSYKLHACRVSRCG